MSLGLGGDDRLYGSEGADEMVGGMGVDWVDYSESNGGVNVHLGDVDGPGADGNGQPTTPNIWGGHAEGDQITSVENIRGSAYNDSIRGDSGDIGSRASRATTRFWGRYGQDTLSGGAGHDTIYGEHEVHQGRIAPVDTHTNDDQLFGGAGRDHIFGNLGSDTIEGGADEDFLNGDYDPNDPIDFVDEDGDGINDIVPDTSSDDWLSYITSNAGVMLALGEGSEVTVGSGGHAEGDQVLHFEHIFGSNYADTLTGNSEDNRLLGRGGDDMFSNGGDGNDTLCGRRRPRHVSWAASATTISRVGLATTTATMAVRAKTGSRVTPATTVVMRQ